LARDFFQGLPREERMGKKRKRATPDQAPLPTSVFTWDEPDRISLDADIPTILTSKRRRDRAVRAVAKELMNRYPPGFETFREKIEDGLAGRLVARPPKVAKPRGAPRKPVTLDKILECQRAYPKASKAKIAARLGINVKTLTRRLLERPASSK
jgi:hypothetical protein